MRLSLAEYVRLSRGLPASEVLRKGFALARGTLRANQRRWLDRVVSTYPADRDIPEGRLQTWLSAIDAEALVPMRDGILAAACEAQAHRFDLLGSGPVVVRHGRTAKGVEGNRYADTQVHDSAGHANCANRAMSTHLRSLLSPAYVPLDWQADFKSGYRWSERTWYHDIHYGDLPGVDVKVPWELSRCQHLPVIALAFGAYSPTDKERRAQLHREFQDQVLDFMAGNPPRYGVNWCCTMDVAIRGANWALAYALFQAQGANAEPSFEREFKRALVAHGRHVVNNLEWFPGLRSNHYLSNLCGLLFIAALLPPEPEADAWLKVAVTELVQECRTQFHDDGSNFEGSTSYHRLSAEMVIYSLALLRAVPHERLNQALRGSLRGLRFDGPGPDPRKLVRSLDGADAFPWDELTGRVRRMSWFTEALTRPDGSIVQTGDNDSGRFFRLAPGLVPAWAGQESAAPNDHSHLVLAANALLGDRDGTGGPDELVISGLTASRSFIRSSEKRGPARLAPFVFPDFGLYVYPGERIWCALRCGSVGQRGSGGHAHNDQLSLELCVDGVALLVDPGTYLYTPLPERRNHLRATAAHNTVVVAGAEQNGWLPGRLGLFSMNRVASAAVVECASGHWLGVHNGFGKECRRSVRWNDQRLEVEDSYAGVFALNFQFAPGAVVVIESERTVVVSRHGRAARLAFDRGRCLAEEGAYSPCYGLIESAPRIRVDALLGRVCWNVMPLGPVWRGA